MSHSVCGIGSVSGQRPSSTSFSLPPTPNMSRSIGGAQIAERPLRPPRLDVRLHARRRPLLGRRAEKLDRPQRRELGHRRRDLDHRPEAAAVVVRARMDPVVAVGEDDERLLRPLWILATRR